MEQCLETLDGDTALTFFSEKKGIVYSIAPESSAAKSCGEFWDDCDSLEPCCFAYECKFSKRHRRKICM